MLLVKLSGLIRPNNAHTENVVETHSNFAPLSDSIGVAWRAMRKWDGHWLFSAKWVRWIHPLLEDDLGFRQWQRWQWYWLSELWCIGSIWGNDIGREAWSIRDSKRRGCISLQRPPPSGHAVCHCHEDLEMVRKQSCVAAEEVIEWWTVGMNVPVAEASLHLCIHARWAYGYVDARWVCVRVCVRTTRCRKLAEPMELHSFILVAGPLAHTRVVIWWI